VNGLAGRPDLYGQLGTQPIIIAQAIIVLLQISDHGLKVTHPRPEASALQQETVVHVYPLTQQRFGHTNSEEILRAREGLMDTCFQHHEHNCLRESFS
jgi:hypothetical protein